MATSGVGRFHGLAAVFGEPDKEGDLVERGAFRKTVRERPRVPLLWAHQPKEPIGRAKLSTTSEGLAVDGEISLDTKLGREAMSLVSQFDEAGLGFGLSIGYNAKDSDVDRQTGVRKLTEVEVGEVSLTPFPTWDAARASVGGRPAVRRAASDPPDTTETDALDEVIEELRDSPEPAAAGKAEVDDGWSELADEIRTFARELRAS